MSNQNGITKDVYWFQHDANARHDPRLTSLKVKHGMAAVGIWWNIIEMLREADGYRLPIDEDTLNTIAHEGMTTPGFARELIEYCVSRGMFRESDGYFYAPALVKRMNNWDERKSARIEAAKKAANARWEDLEGGKCERNATAMRPQCPSDADPMRSDANTVQYSTVQDSMEETPPKPDVNQTRYDNLVSDYGKAIVDDYIQRCRDYVASGKHKAYADYASAAANWMKRDKVQTIAQQIGTVYTPLGNLKERA